MLVRPTVAPLDIAYVWRRKSAERAQAVATRLGTQVAPDLAALAASDVALVKCGDARFRPPRRGRVTKLARSSGKQRSSWKNRWLPASLTP